MKKTEENLKNVIQEAFAETPKEEDVKKAISEGFEEHGTLTNDSFKKMLKKSERQFIMAIVGTGILMVIGFCIVVSVLT
jgi:lipoate-protein ligase A